MSQYADKYKKFFQETDEGEALLKEIDALITAEYRRAEASDTPLNSFSHMKQAAGIRMTLAKINGLMMEAKKPM